MKKVELLEIGSIVFEPLPINPAVLRLVYFIQSGGTIEPVHVQKTINGFKLLDGRHRLAASKLLGCQYIPAKFAENTILEFELKKLK